MFVGGGDVLEFDDVDCVVVVFVGKVVCDVMVVI